MNRHQRRANGVPKPGLVMPARHRAEFEQRQREGEIVHILIMETAKVMAGKAYDKMASQSNSFYAAMPSESDWIAKTWPDWIEPARKALTTKLGLASTDPAEKEIIYEALVLDRSLPKSHTRHLDS
jgi:hypothetical protein